MDFYCNHLQANLTNFNVHAGLCCARAGWCEEVAERGHQQGGAAGAGRGDQVAQQGGCGQDCEDCQADDAGGRAETRYLDMHRRLWQVNPSYYVSWMKGFILSKLSLMVLYCSTFEDS